jgi:hypothetical protein
MVFFQKQLLQAYAKKLGGCFGTPFCFNPLLNIRHVFETQLKKYNYFLSLLFSINSFYKSLLSTTIAQEFLMKLFQL